MKLLLSLIMLSGAFASSLPDYTFSLEPIAQTPQLFSDGIAGYCLRVPDKTGENLVPYHTNAISRGKIVDSLKGVENVIAKGLLVSSGVIFIGGLMLLPSGSTGGFYGALIALFGILPLVASLPIGIASHINANHTFDSKVKNGSEVMILKANPHQVAYIANSLKQIKPDTSVSCLN